MASNSSSTVINDQGEKVIPATRRPDGTWRKEKRVKAGYTPQEEQPVYESKAVMMRKGVPLCPGMEDSEVLAAKANAAKKKEKKKEPGSATQPKPPSAAADSVAATVSKLKDLSGLGGAKAGKAAPPALPAAAEPPTSADPPEVRLEKEIRKLKKKIRECDALAEKQRTGPAEDLTDPEREKLERLNGWSEELMRLEGELMALTSPTR